MATRINTKGQVTIPKKVRETLKLAAGDFMEFALNEAGALVLTRRMLPIAARPRALRTSHPRIEAQTRRRAEELLALLRGLE
jgi:antitoxin PrlF